ncbi:MAG: DUF460 domain-containing protein [Desulfurococcales archaeon]|nr:DUF460 domain-containing protein [Desulfurococcales archaeon]
MRPSDTSREKAMGSGKLPERVVIGVDIVKSGGSDLSQYLYSIAMIRGTSVTSVDEGSLGRLIRLLWDNRPSVLAVDNILELGGTRRNLGKILKLIPPDTEIIQVTLDGKRTAALKEVATKAGISLGREKLDSRRSAALIAVLAALGYGESLNIFERKVKINVYMGRSGNAGGSRSSKYKRNLRGAVARVVKKIREDLERAGIDYDVTIRRSRGGMEKASFIVYAPREELYGIVKKAKGRDVIVKIRPVIRKDFLTFEEVTKPRRYLIVGFDPGTKVGIALIDLDGKPVLITSGKNLDRGSIATLISKEGIPAIVATDKSPVPDMVKKLASMLNAQVYVPPRSLSTAEKELIVADFMAKHGVQVRNTHERDALSAAIKAFRIYEEKLRKLASKVKEMGLPAAGLQHYKARLLSDEPLSSIIEDIINDAVKEGVKPLKERVRVAETPKPDEVVKDLRKKIDELVRERDLYRVRVKELERELDEMKNKVAEIQSSLTQEVLRDRKVTELTQRVSNLEAYVNKLKAENETLKKLHSEVVKAVERVISGELVIVPSLTGRCTLKYVKEGMTWFVDDVSLLSPSLLRNTIKWKYSLILHPKDSRYVAELITKYLIPAAVAKEVWVIGDCIRAVNGSVYEELGRAKAKIDEIKEASERRFTLADLENLLKEYRNSRTRLVSAQTQGCED